MKELITVATQEKLSRLIHEVYLFELLAIVVKLRQREKGFYIIWLIRITVYYVGLSRQRWDFDYLMSRQII